MTVIAVVLVMMFYDDEQAIISTVPGELNFSASCSVYSGSDGTRKIDSAVKRNGLFKGIEPVTES